MGRTKDGASQCDVRHRPI